VCSVGDRNPCVVGNCVNDGYGAYTCVCPPYFYLGTSEFGAPSCAPGVSKDFYIVTVETMWCYHIHPIYGLTLDEFLDQNGELACDAPLPLGTMVSVKTNPDSLPCSAFYTTVQNDTCESIATLFSLTASCPDPSQPCATDLLRLNPGLDCSITTATTTTSTTTSTSSTLPTGLSICLERATPLMPMCEEAVVVESAGNATCAAVLAGMKPALSALELYRMNPGIFCHRLLPPSKDTGFPGSE
ncbi:unnamed protein product, partial [Closterium sp. NIES-53]